MSDRLVDDETLTRNPFASVKRPQVGENTTQGRLEIPVTIRAYKR